MKDAYSSQKRYYAKNKAKVLKMVLDYQKKHLVAVRAYQRAWAHRKMVVALNNIIMKCVVCGEVLPYREHHRRGKYCGKCSKDVYIIQHRKAALKHWRRTFVPLRKKTCTGIKRRVPSSTGC